MGCNTLRRKRSYAVVIVCATSCGTRTRHPPEVRRSLPPTQSFRYRSRTWNVATHWRCQELLIFDGSSWTVPSTRTKDGIPKYDSPTMLYTVALIQTLDPHVPPPPSTLVGYYFELPRGDRGCQRVFGSSRECLLGVCPLNSRPALHRRSKTPTTTHSTEPCAYAEDGSLRLYSGWCPRRCHIVDTPCNWQPRVHKRPSGTSHGCFAYG